VKEAATKYTAGEGLRPFTSNELGRARRLNALLGLLPRYHTDRRWNAITIQALVRTIQFLVPDKLRRHNEIAGGRAMDDSITRPIARHCEMLVAGIDFRNAVDDRLDLTLQDCKMTIDWLVDHLAELQVEHIILGGESSGAHLAAEALLHLRERGRAGVVAGFVSMCGCFDLTGSESLRRSNSESLLINGQSALRNLRRLTPSLSGRPAKGPLFADLSNLPPALLIAGALDPIVDDSLSMAQQWQQQSGNADCVIFPEAAHGFNRFADQACGKGEQSCP
jgi:acetyl esterase/lipase